MADVDATVINATAIGLCAGIIGGVALTLGGIAVVKSYRRQAKRPKSLKLYHSFPFRSVRCAWLVKELCIEEKVEIIDFNIHRIDSTEIDKYRHDVHPHGTLPALVVNDEYTILESGAICLYLADTYGRLVPNRYDRKEYYNWIVYATATIDAVLEPLYMQLTHTPDDQKDPDLIEKMEKKFHVIAKHLESVMEDRHWICGESFSAADCVMGYNIWWAKHIKKGELMKDYPALLRYANRLEGRQALKDCMPSKS